MTSKNEYERKKSLEAVDKKIAEMASQMESMKTENAKFFEDIGISPHELYNFLNNKENFSRNAWDDLQNKRHELEVMLMQKIEDVNASVKKNPSPLEVESGGHWIFVR